MLAPTIGGEILRFTSWRGVFALLAASASLLVVVGFFALPETLPAARRRSAACGARCARYRGAAP